jgi:hypothetical protein
LIIWDSITRKNTRIWRKPQLVPTHGLIPVWMSWVFKWVAIKETLEGSQEMALCWRTAKVLMLWIRREQGIKLLTNHRVAQ